MALLGALGLVACGPGQQAASGPTVIAASTAAPPAGPVAGAPWAASPCDPRAPLAKGTGKEAVVACVQGKAGQGVAITAADVERAFAAYPAGTTAKQVVAALVQAELLAQAAAAAGGWQASLWPVGHQRMAQLLLDQEAAKITPDKVQEADMKVALADPAIKLRYNRAPSYFVTDAQILCCTGDATQCNKREEVQKCIADRKPEIDAVWTFLQANPPASAEEMTGLLQADVARFPHVAIAPVDFYYDKTKSYDKQGAHDLMVPEFAMPVSTLLPGQIHPPIRTPFGWHVPRLDRFEPAVHRPLTDPAVRDEIARNILIPVRGRDLELFAVEQMKGRGVEIFFDRLDTAAGLAAVQAEGTAP